LLSDFLTESVLQEAKEGLMMNPREILTDQRDEILRITAKHGAYNVRIFGSSARGRGRRRGAK